MPASSLLPQNSIGTLIALRQCLADVVVNLCTQDSLIATPAIRVPLTTSCFALGTDNQRLNKLIGMLTHPSTHNQATVLSKTDTNPTVPYV